MRLKSLLFSTALALMATVILAGKQKEIRIPAQGEWGEERIFDVLEELGAYQLKKLDVVQQKGESGKTSTEIVAWGEDPPQEAPSRLCSGDSIYLTVQSFANQGLAMVPLSEGVKEPPKVQVLKAATDCMGPLAARREYQVATPSKKLIYHQGRKVARIYLLKIQVRFRNSGLDLPRRIGRPPD